VRGREDNIVQPSHVNNTNSARFRVVLNHEDQYSIWPVEKPIPTGWQVSSNALSEGTREECLAHISERWTDMSPRSLRRNQANGST